MKVNYDRKQWFFSGQCDPSSDSPGDKHFNFYQETKILAFFLAIIRKVAIILEESISPNYKFIVSSVAEWKSSVDWKSTKLISVKSWGGILMCPY